MLGSQGCFGGRTLSGPGGLCHKATTYSPPRICPWTRSAVFPPSHFGDTARTKTWHALKGHLLETALGKVTDEGCDSTQSAQDKPGQEAVELPNCTTLTPWHMAAGVWRLSLCSFRLNEGKGLLELARLLSSCRVTRSKCTKRSLLQQCRPYVAFDRPCVVCRRMLGGSGFGFQQHPRGFLLSRDDQRALAIYRVSILPHRSLC